MHVHLFRVKRRRFCHNSPQHSRSTMTKSFSYAGERLQEIYEILLSTMGPSSWWPAYSPLEVVLGAVLTQNTQWGNVEKALGNLQQHGILQITAKNNTVAEMVTRTDLQSGQRLLDMPFDELAELLRPVGFFKLKTTRLRCVLEYFQNRCDFDLQKLADDTSVDTEDLREELLSLNGVGPETADSILLYALQRPSFVVDAYTIRLLGRHALLPEAANYERVRAMFMYHLPQDTQLYNEYHALIVRVCKQFCTAKRPACMYCPLGVSNLTSVFPPVDELLPTSIESLFGFPSFG